MSFDVLSRLQEYRQELAQKSKAKSQINDALYRVNSNKKVKSEFNLDHLKADLLKNTKRLQVKSNVNSLALSPSKLRMQSPTVKSPVKLSSVKFKSPAKTSGVETQSFRVTSPKDLDLKQSQVKLYSSKYQKVLSDEQGYYYSQLQMKLDGLAELIGGHGDHRKNAVEIDNLINQSKVIQQKSSMVRQVENLNYQKRALQTDLQNINYKMSRFSDLTDI